MWLGLWASAYGFRGCRAKRLYVDLFDSTARRHQKEDAARWPLRDVEKSARSTRVTNGGFLCSVSYFCARGDRSW